MQDESHGIDFLGCWVGGGCEERSASLGLGEIHREAVGSLRGLRVPPIFGTMKTSAFLTNTYSWFVSVVLNSVLGPPRLVSHSAR